MRNLYLVRHSKSSWKNLSLNDFDRPLNKRGKKDALLMGDYLTMKKVDIDLIISSPAKRTLETLNLLAEKISFNERVQFEQLLYEANLKKIFSVIRNIDEQIQNVMLIGHNPALTILANYLLKENIDNIPTSGIVAIKFALTWKDISKNCGTLLFFEYPKKLKD